MRTDYIILYYISRTLDVNSSAMFRLRNNKKNSKNELKDVIAWRGHEITRIEAFSDAVFALAITLLAVSIDVPKSFEELMVSMKGFLPFSVCFLMFFQVWTAQNHFFRRYGLHDDTTITLNAMLLFAVLFFVYPLKFLWTVLLQNNAEINGNKMQKLMYIYSGGFIVVYVLIGLMYRHANRRRDHLKLSPRESFETETCMYKYFGIASIGFISIGIATIPDRWALILSGACYSLIGVVVGTIIKRRYVMAQKIFHNPDKARENEPVGETIEV